MNEHDLVKKIDAGEELTEKEIEFLLWNCEYADEQRGENRRWYQKVTTVVIIDGRYFMIPWDCGLTELQDNEYLWQPFEVENHEYEKVIKVVEWIRKE